MVIMVEEEKGVKEEEEERSKKNPIKNSIEKRTQDLIERNSPSILSSIRAEQSKAKQSHVVSIKINNQAKSTTFYFFFFSISSLSVDCISHPVLIPSYPVRG